MAALWYNAFSAANKGNTCTLRHQKIEQQGQKTHPAGSRGQNNNLLNRKQDKQQLPCKKPQLSSYSGGVSLVKLERHREFLDDEQLRGKKNASRASATETGSSCSQVEEQLTMSNLR